MILSHSTPSFVPHIKKDESNPLKSFAKALNLPDENYRVSFDDGVSYKEMSIIILQQCGFINYYIIVEVSLVNWVVV